MFKTGTLLEELCVSYDSDGGGGGVDDSVKYGFVKKLTKQEFGGGEDWGVVSSSDLSKSILTCGILIFKLCSVLYKL